MRRFLALLLVFSLLLGVAPALADGISFDASLADGMDYTASEWFSSSINRAALTICLMAGAMSVEKNFDFTKMILNGSYVGKNGISLFVVGRDDNRYIIMQYIPMTHSASYLTDTADYLNDSVLRLALEQYAKDGCYKNDVEDIYQILKLFEEAING